MTEEEAGMTEEKSGNPELGENYKKLGGANL